MKTTAAVLCCVAFFLPGPIYRVFAESKDEAAIRQAVLDYADGFYSGEAVRMERAIHPDLTKAFPRFLNRTGRSAASYTTYSQLLEQTRAKVGELTDSARHMTIDILNMDGDVANVKLRSANFNEYLQFVKMDNQWKIVNVLWNGGSAATAARVPDFQPEKERDAILQAAQWYLEGAGAGDVKRLEMALTPDFTKVTVGTIVATGKKTIQKQKYESLLENTFVAIGKFDETYRDFQPQVLDAMDGLAVVKAELVTTNEYLQVYKSGTQWKVINSIVAAQPHVPLAPLLPALVNEPMPDFTLAMFGGGEFSMSKHRGKNILFMFPRGWLGSAWCAYCPYQYLELAELEKKLGIRKKHNMEIVFVLPYGSEKIADWFDKFGETTQSVEQTKNPPNQQNLPLVQKEYAAWARQHFPKSYDVMKADVRGMFPVLIDSNRTLSKQLKIFTKFWDGVSSEQNISSIFIVDAKGILKFKYIGQMTEDRPSVDYLLEFIKKMD